MKNSPLISKKVRKRLLRLEHEEDVERIQAADIEADKNPDLSKNFQEYIRNS